MEARPSKSRPSPPTAHVIVVFGAGLDRAGRPSAGLEARLRRARAQAQRHPAARLLVSGGAVSHPKPEAEAMAEWLIAHGVAEARIIREAEARFTLDNAEKVADLVRTLGSRRVDLVTEAYHMPRSAALLRAAFTARALQVELLESPAPDAAPSPARAAAERNKLIRDQRDQADLHRRFTPSMDVSSPGGKDPSTRNPSGGERASK